MTDHQCPYPECPNVQHLRRQDDSGTNAILSAIGDVQSRLGRIESNNAAILSTSATHTSEIKALKEESKRKVDRRLVLAAAFIGASSTLAAGAFIFLKGHP